MRLPVPPWPGDALRGPLHGGARFGGGGGLAPSRLAPPPGGIADRPPGRKRESVLAAWCPARACYARRREEGRAPGTSCSGRRTARRARGGDGSAVLRVAAQVRG